MVESWRLAMTGPFVLVLVLELVLDRPIWFRGRGRARERLGSWYQCAILESWKLSMNRPFVLLLVLVIDSSSWLRGRGRGRARERLGSWSQCAMLESWKLSMNRTPSSRPSPPVGGKGPGGRVGGVPTGSWPQLTSE